VVQSYDLGVKRALDYLTSQNGGNLLMVKNEAWKGRNLLHELMEQTFRNITALHHDEREVHVVSAMKELSQNFFITHDIGGILSCADQDAIRVLGRLKQWNIEVPGDVSLVSYGNTELTAYYEPGITVIDSRYQDMAHKTAILIDEGHQTGLYEQHIIEPRLIIRRT
jgi:DNA-binding LacI/PurR family transcriptional regulator